MIWTSLSALQKEGIWEIVGCDDRYQDTAKIKIAGKKLKIRPQILRELLIFVKLILLLRMILQFPFVTQINGAIKVMKSNEYKFNKK